LLFPLVRLWSAQQCQPHSIGRRQTSLWTQLRPGSDGPLRQRALLGLAGEFIGAHTAARQSELRLELPLLEALLLQRMSGDLRPPMRPHLLTAPPLTGPDLRSPQ
jgi:hypothetical protein